MIDYDGQTELFGKIADEIEQEVDCYAFGGTAMLYYGYKQETKDVDLCFPNIQQRKAFIDAIKRLGFEPTNPHKVYVKRKAKDPDAPVMYTDGDARFDLFVERIFRTRLSDGIRDSLHATHEYGHDRSLTVHVVAKEIIVLLKAVTERLRDFDDIILITQRTENLSWEAITQEAIWQHRHGDEWILLDLEAMMQRLRKYIDIPKEHFQALYNTQTPPS